MRMPFELFVALRYLFSRRKQTFIYIISIMSILGVALGVGALVVVLGVYNGLTTDMRDKIIGANAHGIVMSYVPAAFQQHPDLVRRVEAVEHVPRPSSIPRSCSPRPAASKAWCCAASTPRARPGS